MKKAGIIAGMVIWSLVAVRYICEANEKKSDIFTAFATSNCNYVTGKVIGEGEYSIYGNITDKEYAVKNIMYALGIMNDYNMVSCEEEVYCEKISDNGYVKVQLANRDGNNFLRIMVDLKQNTECLYDYKELVRNIFAAEGIKGNVSIYLEGIIRGALNYEERSYLADRMIKKLDGKIVTESRDNDIFTIYAYTSNIEGYIKSVGRKINVNVTSSYDEAANETVIYLATPINNLDY